MQKLDSISASKINTIKDCLGKFHYKYILKTNQVEILFVNTLIGLVIHSLMEESINMIRNGFKLKKINEFIETNFESKYDSILQLELSKNKVLYAKKGFKKPEAIKTGIKWTKEFLIFLNRYLLKYSKEFYTEKRFEFEYKNYLITGFIDFLSVNSKDEYHVLDFKTTSDFKKWYFVDFSSDIQSLFYSFAILNEFKTSMKKFSYLILSKDDRIIFVNSEKENRDEKEITKSFDKIISIIEKAKENSSNVKLYSPDETKCGFCSYSNICPSFKEGSFNFRKYLKI